MSNGFAWYESQAIEYFCGHSPDTYDWMAMSKYEQMFWLKENAFACYKSMDEEQLHDIVTGMSAMLFEAYQEGMGDMRRAS